MPRCREELGSCTTAPGYQIRAICVDIQTIRLERVDADLYVPALIEGVFGSRRWLQQIGGSARSAAKAKASRENGKRGGRPKDKEAA